MSWGRLSAPRVGGAFAAAFTVTSHKIAKRSLDQNERNSRNDEHRHEKAVDAPAMLGCESWKPERLCDKKVKRSNDQYEN